MNSKEISHGSVRSGMPAVAAVLMMLAGASCTAPPGAGPDSMGRPRPSVFGRKGVPWTIRCLELQGPRRLDDIERIAETLRRTPNIRPGDVFFTDDRDGFARLYYGTYYRRTDPKTGKRSIPREMTRDLRTIQELGMPSGERFFLTAMVVRTPTPDVGPPEWDLARATGVYTLQVGVFEPTDEFWQYKQGALEFCELLRKRGYEAYYYHTDSASMVTVGTFGEEAVIAQPRGLPSYSAEVLALQRSDELLQYNRLNGAVYSAQTDKGVMQRVPSRLVRMPQNVVTNTW